MSWRRSPWRTSLTWLCFKQITQNYKYSWLYLVFHIEVSQGANMTPCSQLVAKNPTSAWCFVGCRSSCVLLVSVALLFILATKIKWLQEQTIRITTTQKLKQLLYFLVVVDSWAIPGKEVIRASFLWKIHSSASEKSVFPTAFLSVQ